MLLRSIRIASFASVVVLASVAPRDAHADAPTKTECIDAYTSGQQLKKKGQFRAARERLLMCSRDPCPSGLQADCNEWLSEVQRLQPSFVVTARDRSGADRTDVRVIVDGTEVADRLDGRAIEIDPGQHLVRLEAADSWVVEESLIAREGEKARPLMVTLRPKHRDEQVTPSPSPAPPPEHERKDASWAPWLSGGVAVVALGVFTGFGIAGISQRSDLLASCNNSCSAADKDSVDQKFLVADLALGVAAIATAATVILLVAR